ncbi:hypothetical protein F4677DRAFT_465005 [Hypoxylon crocopeplum]|nr:hypothetical protein F4677DRAFT_465005 [Hypoxylon crocopeplum]
MVGVPGRTEERPYCQRCIKSGLECLGYIRSTQWRHFSTAPFTERPRGDSRWTSKVVPRILSGQLSEQVPRGLDLAAFQDNFCFSFIFSNFVWRGYGALWLAHAAEGKLGPLALSSARALAQSYFGRAKSVLGVEIQGAVQYGKCLQGLRQELGGGQLLKDSSCELVVPILLLMMHACTLTDRAAALFHLKGVSRIIDLCGPTVFQRQPLLNALEAARATMVVASLVTQRRVCLEEPRWHSVPYALDPSAKPPMSYLLDILTFVPGLLEDFSRLEFSGDKKTEPAIDPSTLQTSLLDRTMQKLTILYCWRWRWQGRFGSEVTATNNHSSAHALGGATVKLPNLVGSSPWVSPLNFARPAAAADIMLYNAVLIWLLALMWDLEPLRADTLIEQCANQARESVLSKCASVPYDKFNFTDPTAKLTSYGSFGPLRRPGAAVSVRDPAIEICRAFEWQSRHHGAGDEANFIYMFPIGMAISVLDADPGGRRRIHSLLEANVLTRGYGGYGDPRERRREADRVDGAATESSKLMSDADSPRDSGCSDLQRIKEFGFYVTREVVNTQEGEQWDEAEGYVSNPGLVHLLLLRGRMDSISN